MEIHRRHAQAGTQATLTTNMLERDFREVRRRTRPIGFFPHEESAARIFYGVTNGIHKNVPHPLPIISAEMLT